MKKLYMIAVLSYQEYTEYRLNFLLWRVRSFLFFITLIFFWQAIYGSANSFAGYTKEQMLTYVIASAFLRALIFGTRTGSIATEIRDGSLTRLITKPLNVFSYWSARDIADKFLNTIFAIVEITLVLILFKITIFIPQDPISIVLSLLMVILATILYFLISLLLSFSAFWTDDIWAVRFLFGYIFLDFFSGSIFPLDVLPSWLTQILYFTPFPYMLYFPIKVYLEQINFAQSLQALVVTMVWIALTFFVVHIIWKRGTRNYGAYGG